MGTKAGIAQTFSHSSYRATNDQWLFRDLQGGKVGNTYPLTEIVVNIRDKGLVSPTLESLAYRLIQKSRFAVSTPLRFSTHLPATNLTIQGTCLEAAPLHCDASLQTGCRVNNQALN